MWQGVETKVHISCAHGDIIDICLTMPECQLIESSVTLVEVVLSPIFHSESSRKNNKHSMYATFADQFWGVLNDQHIKQSKPV